ncbi:MAG TPA: single-stranded-DNA-specific exonuclease RecJ [Solirubrobacteraceae bacterium]|nr:single-stranded-DNA-specific exonuclease RecJ [Solirubrobacteraceae bacterium]
MRSVELEIAPCATADVRAVASELGVSPVVAEILVRRGFADAVAARSFLAAEDAHPPSGFAGIELAVELIVGHVRSGAPITVHGDYDCDGVCSTAVLVRCLREVGANVDWFLPDRRSDGYGLSRETIERLADRGTKLLITADCAITAVGEVAAARAAGVDVVVTDHHAPRADGRLPDAPIVHPLVCGYPCPDLCATAVAAKLAEAIRAAAGRGEGERDSDLELVGLATVADVVVLRGENRRLVRAGLRALAGTASPGLRALMGVARVSPLAIDEHALAFRLAPRINAAGRLYRADVALELLLTADVARAGAIAVELDRDNVERRNTETRIRFEAEAQVGAQGELPAYVLAGEGWHPGVIGIVAARIAERHHRPTVMIALDSDGGPATGSCRSIPAFDLLGGLRACGDHLVGYGGHRAAAGLQIEPAAVEGFRAAFTAHAGDVLEPGDLVLRERVDAVVSGEDLGLELAEELLRLAPFGAGNPPISLLVAAATLEDPVGFGGEDRKAHVRFNVRSGGARARAVHFGGGAGLPVAAGAPVDATFRLERNEWQGVVEPRLLLREARACEPRPIDLVGAGETYLGRALAELDRPLGRPAGWADGRGERLVCDRRGRGVAATIAGLVASGEPVLVVSADAEARMRHLRARLGGFALCSHAGLGRAPDLACEYRHLVVLDPPASAGERAVAVGGRAADCAHLAWGGPELRFALHIHQQEFGLRTSLAGLYRALRDLGGAGGGELEAVLRGDAAQPRSPELAGRLLRVFVELDLIEFDRDRAHAGVLVGRRATLEDSPAFCDYQRRLEDGQRYLGKSAAAPSGDRRAA